MMVGQLEPNYLELLDGFAHISDTVATVARFMGKLTAQWPLIVSLHSTVEGNANHWLINLAFSTLVTRHHPDDSQRNFCLFGKIPHIAPDKWD